MGKLIAINGSPRPAVSNSKKYIALFERYYPGDIQVFNALSRDYTRHLEALRNADEILLVFPLYADALPVSLMGFLKAMDAARLAPLKVHVMINCGFYEPEQNDIAIDMLRLFCERNGFQFGSILSLGSGEAILESQFAFMVRWKIRKLAKSIAKGHQRTLKVTMPITKKMFIKASSSYWLKYGRRFGTTREEMDTMRIEDQ